ncbi:MAG: sigma factor, partial [Myxococcota bacterium]
MSTDVEDAVARAAADGYGRLVAWLASRCRDLQLAEDCVGDALEAALRKWPESGIPANPEAWLLTA